MVNNGDVYKRNYDGETFVVIMTGKPTDTPGKFRNHLLVKLGKQGRMLKANSSNLYGANYESFNQRFTYIGGYNTYKEDFHFGRCR